MTPLSIASSLFRQTPADPWSYTYIDIITIVIAAIAIAVSVIAIWITRPIEKKQHQLAILSNLFQGLSTNEQREARGRIFDMYWACYPERIDKAKENKQDGKMVFKEGSEIKDTIRKVESSLNQAGVLVAKKVVEPELFLDLYAGIVVRTWKALEEDITAERKNNQNPALCEWFEKLNELAIRYFKDRNMKIPDIYKRPALNPSNANPEGYYANVQE